MSVSVLLVRARLTAECIIGTNRGICNQMRRSAIFQLWVGKYVRILFVIYSGTKDMINIAIMIHHIYYYVKYQLYVTCLTFYLLFNPTSYLGQNRSLGGGMSSESLFNMYLINPL